MFVDGRHVSLDSWGKNGLALDCEAAEEERDIAQQDFVQHARFVCEVIVLQVIMFYEA